MSSWFQEHLWTAWSWQSWASKRGMHVQVTGLQTEVCTLTLWSSCQYPFFPVETPYAYAESQPRKELSENHAAPQHLPSTGTHMFYAHWDCFPIILSPPAPELDHSIRASIFLVYLFTIVSAQHWIRHRAQ